MLHKWMKFYLLIDRLKSIWTGKFESIYMFTPTVFPVSLKDFEVKTIAWSSCPKHSLYTIRIASHCLKHLSFFFLILGDQAVIFLKEQIMWILF